MKKLTLKRIHAFLLAVSMMICMFGFDNYVEASETGSKTYKGSDCGYVMKTEESAKLSADEGTEPTENPGSGDPITPDEGERKDLTDTRWCRTGIEFTEAKYTGKEICPSISVRYSNADLFEGEDYEITYLNNINCGTATAVITGIGNFEGTITYEFTITMDMNKTFTVGKYKYKVTNATSATFMGLTSKNTPSVVIPSKVKIGGLNYKVTAINIRALRNNKKLTNLIIGSNVKTIGQSAFEGCTNLETLEIGKNVTTIGIRAFYKCASLTDITIPSKVSKIGKQAFFNCKNVSDIIVESKKLTAGNIGSKAFKGTSSEIEVEVPKKKLAAYTTLFRKKGIHSNATYTT